MIQTAESNGVPSRVVNTSSGAHYMANVDFNAFKDGSRMDLPGERWVLLICTD
jgi:hypothetical protein